MEVVVDMTDVVEKLEPEAATEAGVEAGAEAATVTLCGQGCREPEAEEKKIRVREVWLDVAEKCSPWFDRGYESELDVGGKGCTRVVVVASRPWKRCEESFYL